MKRFRKKLALILCAALAAVSTAACGGSEKEEAQETETVQEAEETKEEAAEETPSGEAESQAASEEAAPEEKEEAKPAPQAAGKVPDKPAPVGQQEEPTAAQDTAVMEPDPSEEESIPLGYIDGAFSLNGTAYQLPVSQQALTDAGWTIRFENTENVDAFKMQPGAVINAEMSLTGFEKSVVVTAEFGNLTNEAVLLRDCPLISLYMTAKEGAVIPSAPEAEQETEQTEAAAEEQTETAAEEQTLPQLPALELPSGITWGSSEDEIIAAYGEPTFSGASSGFDCMYENREYYLEFLGDSVYGVSQIIYCVN